MTTLSRLDPTRERRPHESSEAAVHRLSFPVWLWVYGPRNECDMRYMLCRPERRTHTGKRSANVGPGEGR